MLYTHQAEAIERAGGPRRSGGAVQGGERDAVVRAAGTARVVGAKGGKRSLSFWVLGARVRDPVAGEASGVARARPDEESQTDEADELYGVCGPA